MWKDIVEFEQRYEISDNGEVRNKLNQHILSPAIDRYGYYQIGLRKLGDRKKYYFTIHRLVALHFIDEIPINSTQVDHIDHNKLNNHVTNLRWTTSIDNNLNRELKSWSTNKTTNELYITKYKNGFMIRINRSDYKKRIWEQDFKTAIKRRNECIEEIKLLAPTLR